jgi:hypothetical protein
MRSSSTETGCVSVSTPFSTTVRPSCSEIDETPARPIHAVTELGDGDRHEVDRRPAFDAGVASEIARV